MAIIAQLCHDMKFFIEKTYYLPEYKYEHLLSVVWTDLMWTMHYTPLGDPETIAIGAGGNFD